MSLHCEEQLGNMVMKYHREYHAFPICCTFSVIPARPDFLTLHGCFFLFLPDDHHDAPQFLGSATLLVLF